MFKRFAVTIASILMITSIYVQSLTPVFNGYSNTYELYLENNSSIARIITTDRVGYYLFPNVKGESCKVEKQGFNVYKFFEQMGAEILFIETTEDVICYYAYSPNVKYHKQVLGHTINLHVAVGKNQVTLGAPLIYGSF